MLRYVLNFLNGCEMCGGWAVIGPLQVCSFCELKVERIMSSPGVIRLFGEYRGRFAWTWNPEEKLGKRDLLMFLKGTARVHLWSRLAEEFLIRHEGVLSQKRDFLVVPIPARVSLQRDHAWLWASHLAKHTGGLMMEGLLHTLPPGEQKKRDLETREGVRLRMNPEIRKELIQRLKDPQTQLVIADDVVTSGATARAAWMALGRPKECEIWALAYRTTLRNTG